MPMQQYIPIPTVRPEQYGDHGNAFYNIAKSAAMADEAAIRKEDSELRKRKMETELSPENQNYLKQKRDAELSVDKQKVVAGAVDMYSKRLAAVTDVNDFVKAAPYLQKDLEPLGDGARQLMPEIKMKPDLSGGKEIPDNDAFVKDKNKILTALGAIKAPEVGKSYEWDKEIDDPDNPGKKKVVTVKRVYDGKDWIESEAGKWQPKEGEGPRVENIQIDERNVPSVWDKKQAKYVPIKGAGGPKWNPKEEKLEMTESQAREKLFQIAKWEVQLDKTGGVDEYLFAMIAKDSPELAKQMQGADKTEAKNFIKEQRDYYKGFLKSGKKVEPASVKSNVTHTYIPGKGFVQKGK